MKRVIIKEGPLVLVRNLIGAELLVSIFLFIASYFENYEAIFRTYVPVNLARYDIFLVLIFSILQIGLILTIFFRWYFSHYELREREIVRKTGLILRHQKSVLATQILTVGISQSLIERLMRHGTIIIECAFDMEIRIRNVELFGEYVSQIKHMVDTRNTPAQRVRPLADLLAQGEGGRIEFKQTLRWDIRKKAVSKEVERAIMKTIIGFLNADGGTLVIGVDDDGNVVGLQEDFESLPKKNRDSFENHFTALVKAMIGIKFRSLIHTRFEKIGEEEVCIIDVEPSSKPAYLIGTDGKEEFFVRTGNATNPFRMSEAEEYIAMRWKGRE
ncbi:MAG: putative DNA binding domain-containing protein [Candidatus Taylorbacteria bacterium]|nr:putative DNA binding domain-containing protein [Candidatus Taylorbacteria bacterium]